MAGRGKHRGQRGTPRARRSVALPVLVVGLASVGVAGATWAMTTANDEQRAKDPASACLRALDVGAEAITAARTTMGGWRAHVETERDVDEGRVIESDAQRVWSQTVRNGKGEIERFRQADAGFRQVREACDAVSPADIPANQTAALAECRHLAQRVDAVLAAARPAVATWAQHLADIGARHESKVAAHQDLLAYREAPAAIDAFVAAERTYQAQGSCLLTPGSATPAR